MSYEEIKNIWIDYVSSDEYQEMRSGNEMDYRVEFEGKEELINLIGEKKYMDLEDKALSTACDAEMIGFIQGFVKATRLMSECFYRGEATVCTL